MFVLGRLNLFANMAKQRILSPASENSLSNRTQFLFLFFIRSSTQA